MKVNPPERRPFYPYSVMSTISPDQVLTSLRWRYATKKFDPTKKIPPAVWSALEEALVLTPSSFGLQPWKFLVVQDPALREKLKAASWGQTQVTDASHFMVFAVKREAREADVDRLIQRTVEVRQTPEGAARLQGMKKVILDFSANVPVQEWHKRQAYIALGNFMTCAALLGVDVCPMEGLDPAQYDEILGLRAQGLTTAMAAAAGYRAADDAYAQLAKVRYPKEEVIEYR